MPFVGHLESGDRVCVLDYERPKVEIPRPIHCPECRAEFVVKHGCYVTPHFAHRARGSCALGGESVEHLNGKRAVAMLLRQQYKDASVAVEFEVRIGRRIADVAVISDRDGWILEVHEVQLASITTDELSARTTDYEDAGCEEVIWWLGGSANTGPNQDWSRGYSGGVCTITFSEYRSSPTPIATVSFNQDHDEAVPIRA